MPEEQPTPNRVTYTPSLRGAEVTIDGQDVSSLISRFSVDHAAGQIPQVFLELSPRGVPSDFDIEGIVHLRETVSEDPADAVLRFLENVDPSELDRAVLAALELGGPTTYGEATLEVFRGWARGD